MTTRTYTLTTAQAALVHAQIASHCAALKNWMASAVERGDLERAQKLVAELREHQTIFAATNVEAHAIIDAAGAGSI